MSGIEHSAPEALMYSKVAGVVRWSGGTIALARGQSIQEDHPLTEERPDLFTYEQPQASVRAAGSPVVERATARPGEVRVTPGKGPEKRA